MRFFIEHTTEYIYPQPASEAFSELRLRPRTEQRQKLIWYQTQVTPLVSMDNYIDYFGNTVETLSIPFRHSQVSVTSRCEVETHPVRDMLSGLDITVSEAQSLYQNQRMTLFDFLHSSRYVSFSPAQATLSRELLPERSSFSTAVLGLNHYIFQRFTYRPGATDVTSTADKLLKTGEGVCQDFTHLMLGLLRIAGIPARYVSGYIESEPALPNPSNEPENVPLVGAAASHAWVEVFAPNGCWVGLDPTNNMLEGERHIQIGYGRDYFDVPPFKGTYKGSDSQRLSVVVRVSRNRQPIGRDGAK